MQLLKKLLDFYIQSSIHVGIAVFCLVYITSFENNLCKHIAYPCCIMFGTILGYNFLKYFEVFINGRFNSSKYYAIILVCVLSVFGFHFFFKRMINEIQLQIILAGFFVLVYPLLRKYGIFKMFFVSFVVAYLTAFALLIVSPLYNGNVVLDFIKRFFLICALLIPFEIYDSQHDDKTLNTLPQKLGIETAKNIGYLMLLLFLILNVLNFYLNDNIKIQYLVVDIVIALVAAVAIYFSSIKRNQYYTSFWVESIPILWVILLFVF